ncbi:MAG: T9SS type A sorting domain-containing protein [Bacteroidia bacterium]
MKLHVPIRQRLKVIGLLFLFGMSCGVLHAQNKQGNIWYFGDHAGIDFNSGSPVALTNGQTYSPDINSLVIEGTAVISDSSGALLFYTNGTKVWNKNHLVMPNGDSLLGNFSSTQSALIVPQPGSSRYFYVFTTSDFYYQDLQYGFRYSMVDICLDGGSGDVITNQKNILILDTVAEKLTAIRHANGTDYWIIVHKYYSDAFYSYHLSAAGLIDTVISHVGSRHPLNSNPNITGYAIGYLKASPNGQKLCCVSTNGYCIAEYFDFDKSTGIVSNCVNIQTDSVYNYYGVSFSPDNSKLYIAGNLNDYNIYQYDLNAGSGNPDSVKASRTPVAIQGNNYLALQLMTDGKIYVARGNPSTYLGAINLPNNLGLSCNYLDSAVYLNGKTASFGLPNFIDSYDYSNSIYNCITGIITGISSSDSTFCEKQCIDFYDLSTNNPTSWQWFFPGADSTTSTLQNPTNICYNNYGSFDVTLIACNPAGCDTLVLTNFINEYPAPTPIITQSNDTLFSSPGVAYQWWNVSTGIIAGATNSYYIPTTGGDYYVIVTDTIGCAGSSNVITVSFAGINQWAIGNGQLSIIPNPFNSLITIGITSQQNIKHATFQIKNLLGQTVFIKEEKNLSSHFSKTLDLSFLENGIYFLEVIVDGEMVAKKIIKQ